LILRNKKILFVEGKKEMIEILDEWKDLNIKLKDIFKIENILMDCNWI
jgi:hypothetical protein